jgi:hypothetical protein
MVAEDSSLHALHEVIQTVMGWTDTHLYQFSFEDGTSFSDPETFDDPPLGEGDAHAVQLADLGLEQGSAFMYEYDFGDGWEHLITVERIGPVDPKESYPQCVAGERACPPEDCGGPPGYDELLEALADPAHPEHGELKERVPVDFDPEVFDLEHVNTILARARRRQRR